ncbi:chordin protein 2 [Elysia marginata]|uniref:Chordin protein 2 n=1 Tax=Elysia marginata TaxID=1093978 RepID=A0AAV4ER39_9GAST|nr:chordin protein 2 [Elysia marginata]
MLPITGCDYLDNHYEVGEAFPSNRSGVNTNSDDQCVLCHCMQSGEVRCVLQTCMPRSGCSRMIRVADDCCPVCADCATPSGQRMRNGSSWQPTIPQIGLVECVTCTCMDGKIECERQNCPEDSSLPCQDPRHQQGECCKTCPGRHKALEIAMNGVGAGGAGGGRRGGGGKGSTKGGSGSKTGRKKDRKRRPGKGKRKKKGRCRHLKDQEKKKCRRRQKRRRKNRKSSGKRMKFKPDMRVHTVLARLCLHDDTTRLVYRGKGDNFETLYFDGRQENRIEQLYWLIRKGKIQRTDRKLILDPGEVRRTVRVGEVLGTATEKDIKRFKRRLERRQKRCKKKCRRKWLDKTIEKLKLLPLDLSKSCGGRNLPK